MKHIHPLLVAAPLWLIALGAGAEPMKLDAVLSPADEIRLDFEDNKNHFLSLIKRQGEAASGGTFEGAQVVEYGMHDVVGGEGGHATGYLVATTTGGDTAYFKWNLRAQFVKGSEDKTRVINNGHWELAGGTGQFAEKRGVGTLLLEFPSKTERRYVLEGDISPAS
jgi:hypothetical protein